MKRNFITTALADPTKNLLVFLIFSTFGLTLASSAFSDLVLNSFGNWMEVKLNISKEAFRVGVFSLIVLILLLLIAITDLNEWLAKRYAPSTVKPKPLKATVGGLIAIASKTPPGVKSAAETAIEHHWLKGLGNLKNCWLICGGKESEQTARDIIQKLTAHPDSQNPTIFDFDYIDPDDATKTLKISLKNLPEKDVDDPNAIFMLINNIYEEAASEGIEVDNIIADYTGGTKSMTAGLILACAQPERRLQFMRPGGYTPDGRADLKLDSVATEVKVSFRLKAVR